LFSKSELKLFWDLYTDNESFFKIGVATFCGVTVLNPDFKILKEPLVRQFGMDWYQELESIYEAWLTEKK
jgi:hypothetical protein